MATKRKPDTIKPVRAIWQKMFDDLAARPQGVHHSEAIARYRACALESIQALQKPIDQSAVPGFAKYLKELRLQLKLLVSSIDESPEVILGEQPRETVFLRGIEVGMAFANVLALVRSAPHAERKARLGANARNALKWTPEVEKKAEPIIRRLIRGKKRFEIAIQPLAKRVMTELSKKHGKHLSISTVSKNVEKFINRGD